MFLTFLLYLWKNNRYKKKIIFNQESIISSEQQYFRDCFYILESTSRERINKKYSRLESENWNYIYKNLADFDI